MGIQKNATYKVHNGTDFDEINFKTVASQVKTSDGNNVEDKLKAQSLLDAIKTVDGTGSGLDANFIEGVKITNLFMYPIPVPTGGSNKIDLNGLHNIGAITITDKSYYEPNTLPSDFGGWGLLLFFRDGNYKVQILFNQLKASTIHYRIGDSTGYQGWLKLTGN